MAATKNADGCGRLAIDPIVARQKLQSAALLHWWHFLIIGLSLLLTFFAWYYSKSALEERVKLQFDREADHVTELVQERMQKYEDALRGGVALIDTSGGDIEFDPWKEYADSIDIENKYPGINGIGVIHAMTREEVPEYLARQRQRRPDYHIHPPHSGSEYYPISYIIPVQGNAAAVGLDMAHEANRFTAAKRARDTGQSQITGPIILVQDSAKTPGFLFFAPFYAGGSHVTTKDRREHFSGLVYAPFVVKKLMEGTLEKEKRHVGIRLTDGEKVLYDEHNESVDDFDADPLYKRSVEVEMYGRTWSFDIRSAKSFRAASADSQPLTILIGGIVIDSLLVLMFMIMSRASHRALTYADSITHQLEANQKVLRANEHHLAVRAEELELANAQFQHSNQQLEEARLQSESVMRDIAAAREQLAGANEALEESNEELQQFAYVASHDLKTPLRAISGFAQVLQEDYHGKLDAQADDYIKRIVEGVQRMQQLISDLLDFSRIDSRGKPFGSVDANEVLCDVLSLLEADIAETGGAVASDHLPSVVADRAQLGQLIQNLIGNALKYHGEAPPRIHVSVERNGGEWTFSVRDNGIGIAPAHHERVFEIFRRLHTQREYAGTGIGLAVCRRIVQRHGGRIWLESAPGAGSTFYFSLQVATSGVAENEDDPSNLAVAAS